MIIYRFFFPLDDRFNLDVSNKIPVELNCLLLKTAEIIASWHQILKINEQDINFWNGIVKEVETAIHEVCILILSYT